MADPIVWFNPACSKCRTTHGILDERGVDATYLDYQANPPSIEELQRVLAMLDATDAMALVRAGEALWAELGIDEDDQDAVLTALATNPSLIERPIVIVDDRAVIARPPERVLELIDMPRG